MKQLTTFSIVLLILCVFLLSACSSKTSTPQVEVNTTGAVQDTPVVNPPNQVYDYEIILADGSKDIPPIFHLSPDIESIFRINNQRSTQSVFEIPQLSIYEHLQPNEVKYISVVAIRTGYYQLKLNGAPYGTVQVK